MAVTFQPPKILSAIDMFTFWVENLKKEKPHLILKRMGGKYTEVWYEANKELNYLLNKNLELDVKIQELEILDKKNINKFTSITNEIFELKKQIVLNRQRIIKLQQKPAGTKEMIMSYNIFKKIITCFNKKASDEIIKGELLYLGNNLGYSQVRKIIPVARKNIKGRIDWKQSLEYKKELLGQGIKIREAGSKEGANWLVYKNDPWYLRWSWIKCHTSPPYMTCKVKNNRVYAFYATNSNSATGTGKEKVPGNKKKLAMANQTDPLLHTRYFTMDMTNYVKRQSKQSEKLETV